MENLPEADFYEIALVFFGRRHKYVCEGRSMNPTLRDGEVVLVDRRAEIAVGDIVVARHPIEQTGEDRQASRANQRAGKLFSRRRQFGRQQRTAAISER